MAILVKAPKQDKSVPKEHVCHLLQYIKLADKYNNV